MIVIGIVFIILVGITIDSLQFNKPHFYNNRNQDEIKEYSFDSNIDNEPCKVRVNLTLQGRAVAKHQEFVYNN